MIKFLLHDFLGVSHRIARENKNAIYCLQISAIVLEIFKFEKWMKYANEMTDDVIHLTQFYPKYINRVILANLPHRPLKFGRLIVLQEIHLRYKKFCSHGNSLFSSPLPLDLIFSTQNIKPRPQT